MARIRTLKPEFHEDEKVGALPISARYFYLSVWNYCDDVGVARATPAFLKSKIFPYDHDLPLSEIGEWLDLLRAKGLIMMARYNDETYLLVRNFPKHQKIDKPSKTKALFETYEENLAYFEGHPVTVDEPSTSTPRVLHEPSTSTQGGLAVGIIREGSHKGGEGKSKGRERVRAPVALVPTAEPLAQRIWKSYQDAYFARYGTEPVRNAKVNSQVKQLGERLGEEAPDVVAFFVSHNKTYYASKLHEIGICLADAESLRTQWAKGKAVTTGDLRRFEKAVESREIDRMIEEGKI